MKQYREYLNLLFMTQDEVEAYVYKEASRLGFEIEHSEGNYIYCNAVNYKPNNRPLLISHMDTVDTHSNAVTNVSLKDIDINHGSLHLSKDSNCVLGADDRSGVGLMLELMRTNGSDYNFLFTCNEEVGGIGSNVFVTDTRIDYHEHSCFISLDRRGNNDVATYGCDNNNLIKIFEDRGYVEQYGSFTDCLILSESCEVACVNLSVGYDNEHTSREVQNLDTMFKLLLLLQEESLVEELTGTCFIYSSYDIFSNGEDYIYNNYKDGVQAVTCENCGAHDLLYEVEIADGHSISVCEDCIDDWSK